MRMNALAEIIRSRIERDGIISFARFMELALYHPRHGYYETTASFIGKTGDFFTSVSVSALFGELLAFQFARWMEADQQATPRTSAAFQLVEAGAHDGHLAADILTWLQQHRPALFNVLDYWIVEPSERRRARQEEKLDEFAPRVRWLSEMSGPHTNSESAKVRGIIFANELLDAMPLHRLGWDASNHAWFEWGIGVEGNGFVWRRMPLSSEAESMAPQLSVELGAVLPDGFITEVCPLANRWWRNAARWLRRGRLLAIDYGLTEEELFVPHRAQGTLRAYSRHHLANDLLAQPGKQDLTAHVNFSALQKIGERMGLKTEDLSTQSQFLVPIFALAQKGDAEPGELTPERARQFQTLTHPEHLGRSFRVLVQRRD